MLPYLKNRQEASVSGEDEPTKRKPDDDAEYDMLDAVAEDILKAIAKKDVTLLKSALSALCEHIQSLDESQDQMMGEV